MRRARLNVCEGCGRDCSGLFCRYCGGKGGASPWASRADGEDDDPRLPLEDDYSDEANADSVCDDDHAG
jgi:hypothetical protein